MILVISVIAIILAICLATYKSEALSIPKGSAVLLVIAHPDDEVMFFGPTVTALADLNIPVHLLCLSNGNSDGLGQIREKELSSSLGLLGIKNHLTLNLGELKDGFHLWSPSIISKEIAKYISKFPCSTILTFDDYGVSGHPNHISIYHGVSLYVKSNPTINAWALTSVWIVRKYSFILDLLTTLITSKSVFISSFTNYWKIRSAMHEHKSQLVWFRRLYIIFSRYMYVNDWKKI